MNTKALVVAIVSTQLLLGAILLAVILTASPSGGVKTYPCYRDDGKGGWEYSAICDGSKPSR
jgi:hypothetical protein